MKQYNSINKYQYQLAMSKVVLFIALLLLASILAILNSNSVGATKITGWDPGNIMSDGVMANKNTMTQSQIQSFLNSKNTCKTSPKKPSVLTAVNKAGTYGYLMSGGTKFEYHLKGGKFICLADQSFNGESAARIIYRASQDYNINPQVLIVLLQKENGLITDNWPNYNFQYATAMGYACPDSGPNNSANCNSNYFGFKNQVRHAASMFRTLLDGRGFNNYPVGNNRILYNPSSSCGSGTVNVKNRATGALYTYTPYQPNSATLKRDWPISSPLPSCGAYGNLNFYMMFKQWFGDTKYIIEGSILKHYNNNNGAKVLGSAVDHIRSDNKGFYWQKYENGYIAGQANTGYYTIKGSIGAYYSKNNGPNKLGKPLAREIKNPDGSWSQVFNNGILAGQGHTGYYFIKGSFAKFYKDNNGLVSLGKPLQEIKSDKNGVSWQQYEKSYVIGSTKTGYWKSNGVIRKVWGDNGFQNSEVGIPTGPEKPMYSGGSYQTYTNGAIIGSVESGYFTLKGALGDTYLKNMTNSISRLGLPLADEKPLSGGYSQQFQKGYISGGAGKYYPTSDNIYNYWITLGAHNSALGPPIANKSVLGSGEYQLYKNGAAIGSSQTGYRTVKGAISFKYLSNISKYFDILGFPIENEKKYEDSWQQRFQHGYIVGSKGQYHISSKSIRDYWMEIGALNSKMGSPIRDLIVDEAGASWQHFESGGVIIVNPKNGSAWESNGSIRKAWASLGYQNGRLGYPTGPETYSSSSRIWSQTYEYGKIQTRNGKLYKVTYS